jgi:hypothetical protein
LNFHELFIASGKKGSFPSSRDHLAVQQLLLKVAKFTIGGKKNGQDYGSLPMDFVDMAERTSPERPVLPAENEGLKESILLQ